MDIGDDVIQYAYDDFKHVKIYEMHHKHAFIQDMIKTYACFQEKQDHKFSKWNQKLNHSAHKPISKKMERPIIGNRDTSIENTLRKDFQTLLNKLTTSNLDTMIRKIRMQFNKDYMTIYTDLLYDYFKRQPDFQNLYIDILETIYQILSDDDIITMNIQWMNYWNEYMLQRKWILQESLVLNSEDYDIFCDYLKEKKKNIALAQAWGRLLALGSINIDPYEWLLEIVNYCSHMDFQSKYHMTSFDCYIEQMREFYKVLPKHIQNNISSTYLFKLYHLQDLNLPKIGYFKLLEFLEFLEKNEIVFKLHHKMIEDGL